MDSKIIANGNCSHEIKMLAPWKESYDKLRQVLKSKDLSLPTKVHLVEAVIFPVVMFGYKSWAIDKAEH